MLLAFNEHEEPVMLTKSIAKTTLQQMRTENFYCPQCKEKLVLKAGVVKIPHFAHQAHSDCTSYFSEGESHPHLLGKSQLFNHFSQYYKTQLEPYLPALQQRPDILIESERRYAIEFQCSRLDAALFNKRTTTYKAHGLRPIWLVKTPNIPARHGHVAKGSLNRFYQQFIQDGVLVTYNPERAQFVYFNAFLYLQGTTFLYITRVLPLAKQRMPMLEVKQPTLAQFEALLHAYHEHRQRFLKQRLFYSRQGVQDLFLRAVYELRLMREQLPRYIGIPVPFAQAISFFAAEWQLCLLYFMEQQELTVERLNQAALHYFFQWLGLSCTNEAFRAVEGYLSVLRRLSISRFTPRDFWPNLPRILYDDFVAINWKD